MELKVMEVEIPEKISFNYEELKNELTEKVEMYSTMVYTDDQIKEAKADKSQLNKLKKALNDERIRREREYMAPFNEFKAQVNDIISIIDKPIGIIDKQVKEYEEKCRQEKKEQISEYFDALDEAPDWLNLTQIASPKWLNATTSMKSIKDEISASIEKINSDLATLSDLPEFGFEATEVYKSTLDMNRALNEGKRLAEIQKKKEEMERMKAEAAERARLEAERKAEEEKKKAEEPEEVTEIVQDVSEVNSKPDPEPEQPQWVSFAALLTTQQAFQLKAFFEARGIEYKPI